MNIAILKRQLEVEESQSTVPFEKNPGKEETI
jgi:hypothetical protein